jgi:hypothetical protein
VVFVRNAAGGVSSRGQRGAAWQDGWAGLGGTDVQDGLAGCAGGDGGVDLFASSRQRVVHWRSPRPGAPFALDDAYPSEQPAGPPLVVCGDGPARVFYRRPGTAELATAGTVVVPGATGAGGLSALRSGPDVVVWARTGSGGVATATPGRAGWSDLGGAGIVDTPAALRDGSGGVLLLGESSDGRLMVNQQPARSTGFGGWQLVGS